MERENGNIGRSNEIGTRNIIFPDFSKRVLVPIFELILATAKLLTARYKSRVIRNNASLRNVIVPPG